MSSDPQPLQPGGNVGTIGTPMALEVPPRVFRVRLSGMLFDTDKTFLLPSSMKGIRGLKKIYDANPGLHLLVVGHADSVGAAEYNRKLSVERAKSIGAFLTDEVDFWLEYYGGRPGSSAWGSTEDRHMLEALGFSDVSSYQTARGLEVDGSAGTDTRRQLVTDYMAQDDTTLPPGTNVETHGCGEAHPEIPTPDGVAEDRNRRVEVFLFEEAVDPVPVEPCPQPGGCSERPEWVGRSKETIDLGAELASLTVTVTDTTGASVPEAQIHLAGTVPEDAVCGVDGVAHMSDLFAARYEVYATRAGYGSDKTDAELLPGGSHAVSLVLPIAPWGAEWETVTGVGRIDEPALMHLLGPGLVAGDPVTFEVTQVGFGVVTTIEATAETDRATAELVDWLEREAQVTEQVELEAGQSFPQVQFTFTARAKGREAAAEAPILYADVLHVRLVRNGEALADTEYKIVGYWGTRTGRTDDDGLLKEEGLPPGGISVFVDDVLFPVVGG